MAETAVVQQLDVSPAAEAGALISMIERVAVNPAADIDKMERLLQMRERVVAAAARTAFDSELAIMQPKLPVIEERGGITNNAGKVQSTYALWEDINDAIKPILSEHGFALNFRVARPEGMIAVTGVLSHRGGHREETTIALPADTSGSKNSVQAIGSSTSYGQRYTAKLLLNLTSRGADDDGNAGGERGGSAAVQAGVAAINMCTSLDELRAWKASNLAGLDALATDDSKAIVAHFNTRFNRMKGDAK